MVFLVTAVGKPPYALSQAGPELDAGAFSAQRQARTNAQHRSGKFEQQHPRPVHVHFPHEHALDLRNAGAGNHAVHPQQPMENTTNGHKHKEPAGNIGRIFLQELIEPGQVRLGDFQQIAEQGDGQPG